MATAALAAAHDAGPRQIANTLSLRVNGEIVPIMTRRETRLDNRKFEALFGVVTKMLDASEFETEPAHPVGGVCPFWHPAAGRHLLRQKQDFCRHPIHGRSTP